jgi:hypothetical protein
MKSQNRQEHFFLTTSLESSRLLGFATGNFYLASSADSHARTALENIKAKNQPRRLHESSMSIFLTAVFMDHFSICHMQVTAVIQRMCANNFGEEKVFYPAVDDRGFA